MDVNDVSKPAAKAVEAPVADGKRAKLKPASTLSTSATDSSGVGVSVSTTRSASGPTPEVRSQASQLVSVINIANDATSEIERLVRGVKGIVSQVDSERKIPEDRVPLLEREANQLIGEIKTKANTPAPNGVKPLAGDRISLEIEEKLGKSLDVILPDDAKDAFGMGSVQFSTKDAIIQARVSIARAEERLTKLRESLSDTSRSVADTVASLDVAVQNSEASQASIRDVDRAFEFVNKASQDISSNPPRALNAIGLTADALRLLQG